MLLLRAYLALFETAYGAREGSKRGQISPFWAQKGSPAQEAFWGHLILLTYVFGLLGAPKGAQKGSI